MSLLAVQNVCDWCVLTSRTCRSCGGRLGIRDGYLSMIVGPVFAIYLWWDINFNYSPHAIKSVEPVWVLLVLALVGGARWALPYPLAWSWAKRARLNSLRTRQVNAMKMDMPTPSPMTVGTSDFNQGPCGSEKKNICQSTICQQWTSGAQLTRNANAGPRDGFQGDGRLESRPAAALVVAFCRRGANGVAVKVLTRLVVEAKFAQLQSCPNRSRWARIYTEQEKH